MIGWTQLSKTTKMKYCMWFRFPHPSINCPTIKSTPSIISESQTISSLMSILPSKILPKHDLTWLWDPIFQMPSKKLLCIAFSIRIALMPIKAISQLVGLLLSVFYLFACSIFSTMVSKSLLSGQSNKWWKNSKEWPKILKPLQKNKSIWTPNIKPQLSPMLSSRSAPFSVLSSEVQAPKLSVRTLSRKATWTPCSRVKRNALSLVFAISENSQKLIKFLNKISWNSSIKSVLSSTRQSIVMVARPIRTSARLSCWFGRFLRVITASRTKLMKFLGTTKNPWVFWLIFQFTLSSRF